MNIHELHYRREKMMERLVTTIVWRLPRWVVYWATIRLFAHATTGRYSSTVVTDLKVGEALKRWAKP